MKILCKLLGHKWRAVPVGMLSASQGAIIANMHECTRCDETYTYLSTTISIPKIRR